VKTLNNSLIYLRVIPLLSWPSYLSSDHFLQFAAVSFECSRSFSQNSQRPRPIFHIATWMHAETPLLYLWWSYWAHWNRWPVYYYFGYYSGPLSLDTIEPRKSVPPHKAKNYLELAEKVYPKQDSARMVWWLRPQVFGESRDPKCNPSALFSITEPGWNDGDKHRAFWYVCVRVDTSLWTIHLQDYAVCIGGFGLQIVTLLKNWQSFLSINLSTWRPLSSIPRSDFTSAAAYSGPWSSYGGRSGKDIP